MEGNQKREPLAPVKWAEPTSDGVPNIGTTSVRDVGAPAAAARMNAMFSFAMSYMYR